MMDPSKLQEPLSEQERFQQLVRDLNQIGVRDAELARTLGVTPSHLLRLKRGERPVTHDRVNATGQLLDERLDRLVELLLRRRADRHDITFKGADDPRDRVVRHLAAILLGREPPSDTLSEATWSLLTPSARIRVSPRRATDDESGVDAFRRVCKFDFDHQILLVASSVSEVGPWQSHFQLATGSGQFFAVAELWPKLLAAFGRDRVRLTLDKLEPLASPIDAATREYLGAHHIISLGGAPTNRATAVLMEALHDRFPKMPLRYDITADPPVVRIGSDTTFAVTGDTDWALVIATTNPFDATGETRAILLIGGTTYGTEGAAAVLCSARSAQHFENYANVACIVKTQVLNHRSSEPTVDPSDTWSWSL